MSDWDIAGGLAQRLEERDYEQERGSERESGPQFGERGYRPPRDLAQPWDKGADDNERSNVIRTAFRQSAEKQAQRDVYSPPAPPVPDTMLTGETAAARDIEHRHLSISGATDWQYTPQPDRQRSAYAAKQLAYAKDAARSLGIEEPRTATDVARTMELMNGGQAAPARQQAADPKAEAVLNKFLDDMTDWVLYANSIGTTLPELLQRWGAAEHTFMTNPVGALKWLCAANGINPLYLADPALQTFDKQARATGQSLAQVISRYIAAESCLEQDPIRGLLWIAGLYGVNAGHLLNAMKRVA